MNQFQPAATTPRAVLKAGRCASSPRWRPATFLPLVGNPLALDAPTLPAVFSVAADRRLGFERSRLPSRCVSGTFFVTTPRACVDDLWVDGFGTHSVPRVWYLDASPEGGGRARTIRRSATSRDEFGDHAAGCFRDVLHATQHGGEHFTRTRKTIPFQGNGDAIARC